MRSAAAFAGPRADCTPESSPETFGHPARAATEAEPGFEIVVTRHLPVGPAAETIRRELMAWVNR